MPRPKSSPSVQKKDQRHTICLSADLESIADTICLKERYRSHSECYASFLRHWALSQQDHALTGQWSALSIGERTALDADLRRLVESGKGRKGSFLKKIIYDCIKELNGLEAKSPTIEQVLAKLPEAIRAGLKS